LAVHCIYHPSTVITILSVFYFYFFLDTTMTEIYTLSLHDALPILILDFWATWCGPCVKSFPGMQVAVNKYKDNPNVVFLFIDTWENGTTEENNKNVVKFIKDNNYSFNVLFDTKTSDEAGSPYKVVEDYKVSGIPTKFIIGPDGKIKFKRSEEHTSEL